MLMRLKILKAKKTFYLLKHAHMHTPTQVKKEHRNVDMHRGEKKQNNITYKNVQ